MNKLDLILGFANVTFTEISNVESSSKPGGIKNECDG